MARGPGDETTFWRVSDLGYLGTETQRRRQANMARLRGTGQDPEGRYGEGEIFDVPEESAVYEDLLAKGWAEEVDPRDDPARTNSQIAQAVVQNQALTDPVDQEIAEELEDEGRVYDIVHEGHGAATAGDAGLDPGKGGRRPGRRQDRNQRTPQQVTALSRASHDPEGYEEFATGERQSGRGQSQATAEYDSDVYTSAAAQSAAEAAGLSPSDIEGTGADGKIKVDDVEKAKQS